MIKMHKDYDWARLVTWINYIGKSALWRRKKNNNKQTKEAYLRTVIPTQKWKLSIVVTNKHKLQQSTRQEQRCIAKIYLFFVA